MPHHLPHPTHGGLYGHLMRRAIHVAMAAIPWGYYPLIQSIERQLPGSATQWTLGVLLLILISEAVRLGFGWRWVGHRHHEQYRIASFAWGSTSVILVLLLVPGGIAHGQAYATPLIMALALADPWLGEARHYRLPRWLQWGGGLLIVAALWGFAAWYFQLAWWLAMLMPPLTIAAEHIPWRWVDDNATISLIPLAALWLLHPLLY